MCDECSADDTSITVVLTFKPHAELYWATCQDWPIPRIDPEVTIADLATHLREFGPLSEGVTGVLEEIGGRQLAHLWAEHMVGDNVAPLRSCPSAVRDELRFYEQRGIAPADAALWCLKGVSAADAGIAVSRGLTLTDYCRWLKEFRSLLDYSRGRSPYRPSPVVGGPADWIEAGVSLDNFAILAAGSVDPTTAGTRWEPLIARFQPPRSRLVDYLRAQMTTDDVEVYERRIAAGEDLDDTIAMLAAFAPKAVEVEAPF
ncbi:MAG: hypothetical protein NVS3B1_11460 [Marmoricola sp.]